MFGLSFTHLVLLAILALVFLGPEQLPELARTLARLLNEWKRATGDIQSHLTSTLREDFNMNRMIDPQLAEQAKKDQALAAHQAAGHDHPVVQGPNIVHDKPESSGDEQT